MKDNINAKKEFLNVTKNHKVINATIWKGNDIKKIDYIDLLEGYSIEDYNRFLVKLDFDYDNGYGCQELFGLIGCENSVWFNRVEYDGSEWWEEHEYPNIDDIIKSRILDKLEKEEQ